MSNILLIEDEKGVAEIIKAYLEKEGYSVYCTDRGREGIKLFSTLEFKLVILDLMLPDISGEQICQKIREVSNVHIFILTAKTSLDDRVNGLNLGADEYLVKPFSPRELTARVNALFRRLDVENKAAGIVYDDGYLLVDYDKRVVKVKNKEVAFTPNEFDILYNLIINKGKVLTREQFIDRIFGFDFEGYDRTVDVHIKNIRKKIEEDTKKPRYVITVVKVGYKFGGGE